MRAPAAWAIGVGLVAAAWCVIAVTPPDDASFAPFYVDAKAGAPAEGRNFAVTVTGVHRAAHVESGQWSADGNWLVVDLDAVALQTEYGASLAMAELHLGDRVFSATERTDTMADEQLTVGIPRSGSVAFELPPGLDGGAGEVQFALTVDPRLNSVIAFPVDLGALTVEPSVDVHEPDWTDQ